LDGLKNLDFLVREVDHILNGAVVSCLVLKQDLSLVDSFQLRFLDVLKEQKDKGIIIQEFGELLYRESEDKLVSLQGQRLLDLDIHVLEDAEVVRCLFWLVIEVELFFHLFEVICHLLRELLVIIGCVHGAVGLHHVFGKDEASDSVGQVLDKVDSSLVGVPVAHL